jgi:hypothetical protein
LVGIEVEHGWMRKLSKQLDFNEYTLRNWIVRGVPEERISQIEKKGYPPETWLVPEHEAEDGTREIPEGTGYLSWAAEIGRLTDEEITLIKALREIDPIGRRGVYLSALTQLNEAMREREIRRDKRKREILEDAARKLSRAVGGE